MKKNAKPHSEAKYLMLMFFVSIENFNCLQNSHNKKTLNIPTILIIASLLKTLRFTKNPQLFHLNSQESPIKYLNSKRPQKPQLTSLTPIFQTPYTPQQIPFYLFFTNSSQYPSRMSAPPPTEPHYTFFYCFPLNDYQQWSVHIPSSKMEHGYTGQNVQ